MATQACAGRLPKSTNKKRLNPISPSITAINIVFIQARLVRKNPFAVGLFDEIDILRHLRCDASRGLMVAGLIIAPALTLP
jgi:hypothetical protein